MSRHVLAASSLAKETLQCGLTTYTLVALHRPRLLPRDLGASCPPAVQASSTPNVFGRKRDAVRYVDRNCAIFHRTFTKFCMQSEKCAPGVGILLRGMQIKTRSGISGGRVWITLCLRCTRPIPPNHDAAEREETATYRQKSSQTCCCSRCDVGLVRFGACIAGKLDSGSPRLRPTPLPN